MTNEEIKAVESAWSKHPESRPVSQDTISTLFLVGEDWTWRMHDGSDMGSGADWTEYNPAALIRDAFVGWLSRQWRIKIDVCGTTGEAFVWVGENEAPEWQYTHRGASLLLALARAVEAT